MKNSSVYLYSKFHLLFGYTIVGLIATVTHFVCLYTLVDLLHLLTPIPASIVAFLCGATVGFICNRNFVFKSTNAGAAALGKYMLLTALSGTNNTILMFVLVKIFTWHYLLAQLFATGCIFLINYFCCKFWIFKEPSYAK